MDFPLVAPILFTFGPLAITNSMFTAFAIMFIFVVFASIAGRSFSLVPTRVQVFIELVAEFIMGQLVQAFGSEKRARQYFPFIMSLLFFIAIANQFTLIPLVSALLLDDQPLFRLPTADLSLTFALSLMVLLIANGIAFSMSPLVHIGKFIRIMPLLQARSLGGIANGLLELFLGLLDIIGEIAKGLSLSFRLFGNVFAGELMVGIIASLTVFTAFLAPIPFMILSFFSGVVQAFVFVLLTIQFIAGSISDYVEQDV